eukprot:TRINITY_DN21995_c0_g1_i2.p2 TRINITY_DN21995_c0_g1~~TRINITY_DN21995_c0_g1_i2.p2  ORF type:complete len:111 (+),score=17.13 TRINITY_DN21995_c0_g1_i2:377-709(+)
MDGHVVALAMRSSQRLDCCVTCSSRIIGRLNDVDAQAAIQVARYCIHLGVAKQFEAAPFATKFMNRTTPDCLSSHASRDACNPFSNECAAALPRCSCQLVAMPYHRRWAS